MQPLNGTEHKLPGGFFDEQVKKPATNLCKKIIAIAAAVFTFLAFSAGAWWAATSEHLICMAQDDALNDCDYNFTKTFIVGVGIACVLSVLIYRPLNDRAQTVLVN